MTYEEIVKDNYEAQQRYAEMQRQWNEGQQKIAAMNALVQMHIATMGNVLYMGLNPNLFREAK